MNEVLGRRRPTNLNHTINGMNYGFQFGDRLLNGRQGAIISHAWQELLHGGSYGISPTIPSGITFGSHWRPKICLIYKETR
jgi:hypothetical protein